MVPKNGPHALCHNKRGPKTATISGPEFGPQFRFFFPKICNQCYPPNRKNGPSRHHAQPHPPPFTTNHKFQAHLVTCMSCLLLMMMQQQDKGQTVKSKFGDPILGPCFGPLYGPKNGPLKSHIFHQVLGLFWAWSGLALEHQASKQEQQTSNQEQQSSKQKHQTSKPEQQSSNQEHQSSKPEQQSSKQEQETSHQEHQTSKQDQ